MTPTVSHRDVVPGPQYPMGEPVLLPDETADSDVSLLSIFIVLLRHRWLIICSSLLFFTVFAFGNYTPIDTYTSTVSFSQRQRSQASAGSALLSQLGLGGGGQSGGFYLELIKSREILGPVVESTFVVKTDTGVVRGRLIDVYGIKHSDKRWERALAVGTLNGQAKLTTQASGLLRLTVTTPYADLSAALAQKILDELNRYNLKTRKNEASAERLFIEAQLNEASDKLRMAENDLQNFMSSNRNMTTYSAGTLQIDRLKRQVSMRQELYTGLAKQLDAARTEEVRNNPVISIVEPAEEALSPNPPVWPAKAVMGAILGALVGIFGAFVHAYFVRRREEETDEFQQMADLKRKTVDDLKHFWRPLGRILATGRP